MLEKTRDILARPISISVFSIIMIIVSTFSCYLFIEKTYATKNEVESIRVDIQSDIKEIKSDIQYLIRLNMRK